MRPAVRKGRQIAGLSPRRHAHPQEAERITVQRRSSPGAWWLPKLSYAPHIVATATLPADMELR